MVKTEHEDVARDAPHPSSPSGDGAVPPSRIPDRFTSVEEVDQFLATPNQALIDDLADVDGDILILGIAGKMGPTLARLARNAAPGKRIVGVARFSEAGTRETLENWGVETIAANLLDREQVEALPRLKNVLFMAGRKFGSSDDQSLTWAMNVHAPALVGSTFTDSRMIVFSTGNVYPLVSVVEQGASEKTVPSPVGEYAQSCLGRERMFEYFSGQSGIAGRIFRLNYAIDLRYGVLFDLASRIRNGSPIDVSMGHVNVIWQGDANAQALRCLKHCTTPMTPINISGPEALSIRWLANELGSRLERKPEIVGSEAATALLSNTTLASGLFGYPQIPLERMLDWVADWVANDREHLNKPTKYEIRDGRF